MCLYTYQRKAKLALKDIVVYKVLSKELIPPVMYRYQYILDTIHVSGMSHTFAFKDYDKRPVFSVEEGLHSFRNKFAARTLCKNLNEYRCRRYRYYIYKAIIPMGSYYYIGDDDDIVSDRLIIKRKLWLNLF